MTKEELKEKASIEELKFYRDFWKQYIELEKLFLETEKYVAISEKNKNTFGGYVCHHFMRLYKKSGTVFQGNYECCGAI